MKEDALLIASRLDTVRVLNNSKSQESVLSQAQDMIRRLVEELDKHNPSMFTILSCGCKSEFMGFPSEWDGETRECEPCVNYGSLCEQHFMEYEARPAQYIAQTKPLSDEEIQNIWYQHEKWLATVPLSFARAIEERHGIK